VHNHPQGLSGPTQPDQMRHTTINQSQCTCLQQSCTLQLQPKRTAASKAASTTPPTPHCHRNHWHTHAGSHMQGTHTGVTVNPPQPSRHPPVATPTLQRVTTPGDSQADDTLQRWDTCHPIGHLTLDPIHHPIPCTSSIKLTPHLVLKVLSTSNTGCISTTHWVWHPNNPGLALRVTLIMTAMATQCDHHTFHTLLSSSSTRQRATCSWASLAIWDCLPATPQAHAAHDG
jgi:hypothetical protein